MATTSTWVAATTFLAGSLCPAALVAGSNGFLNALEGSGQTYSSTGGDRQFSSRSNLFQDSKKCRQYTQQNTQQNTFSRLTTTLIKAATTSPTTVKEQNIRSEPPSEMIKALPLVEKRFKRLLGAGDYRSKLLKWLRGPLIFDNDDVLGESGGGLVLQAKDIETKKKVALKWIKDLAGAANELYVLDKIQEAKSPLLCQFVGGFQNRKGTEFYVAMPLYGSSLQAVLEQRRQNINWEYFSQREILELAQRLTEAVHTCHKLGLVHRDIKPANFVCERHDDVTHIRLLDFGRAVFCLEGLQDHIDSSGYTAPEVSGTTCGYNYRVDIFSLGLTIGALATLECPIFGRTFGNIAHPWRYSQEFCKLLEDMTAVDPDHRPSLDSVLERIGVLLAKLPAEHHHEGVFSESFFSSC